MSIRTYPGYNGGFAIGTIYTHRKWIEYEEILVESLIDEESRNFPAGFSSTLPGIYFETLIFDDCSAWLDSLVNKDNYYEVQPYQGYS